MAVIHTHYLNQLDDGCVDFFDSSYNRYVPGAGVLFVAGTNTSGVHGKGAAKSAYLYYGAPRGHCNGRMNRYYGIPTREILWPNTPYNRSDKMVFRTLPLQKIEEYVQQFVSYTHSSQYTFLVTAVGCGEAGYKASHIAPLFKDATRCWFPDDWQPFILG